MRDKHANIENLLADPIIVATGCSWRRLLQSSGKAFCVPTNSTTDGHPDLDCSSEDLALLSASPELYESVIMLTEAVNSLLSNKRISNLDEIMIFSELALKKAETPII